MRFELNRFAVQCRAYGLLISLWAVLAAQCACAQDTRLESAGFRLGGSLLSPDHHFREADAFGNVELPWSFDVGAHWRGQLRLELSAGWLNEQEVDGVVGTLGPALLFRKPESRFSADFGVSPTFLSRVEFPTKNFGTCFQFTTHLGVNMDINAHIRFGYRFQHMSNAGLAKANPGLNLQMLSVSWLF